MEASVVPHVEEQAHKAPFLHVGIDEIVRVGHERWVPCPFCHQPHVKLHFGEIPADVNICPTSYENYKIVAMYDIKL